ncbi:MAG: FUSC family protein [Oscillospiraceae bacterium]|nr:FUSC family protein [Oscillospiraceae bacterium]
MRNVKTALTATLCALLYLPFDRNPTFACIGAVFGMGYDMNNSKLHGGNRLFGTVFGGLIAMALFRIYIIFYPTGETSAFMLFLFFIGVVVLILVSQNLWPGAVQPGSVVLSIIFFNTPVETYISYSLNRIFDTGVGVVVALLVNYFLPRERLVRWLEAAHLRKKDSSNLDD